MNDFSTAIREAVHGVGSQEKFAQLMGVKNRHTIKTWISTGNVPAKHVAKFCILTGARPESVNRDLAAIAHVRAHRKTV